MEADNTEPPILLLIDIQHGLVEPPSEWGARSTANLVENVAYLLKTWRSNRWPIIHVHHDDTEDPTNPIAQIHPETFAPHECSKPENDEKVFIKHVGSPFVATRLPAAIKDYGGDRKIVVIGMDGGQCINNTTRHGADLGYSMVVIGDACASFGMYDWKTGKQLGAEETHDAAMGLLTSCAIVTTTENVLGDLGY